MFFYPPAGNELCAQIGSYLLRSGRQGPTLRRPLIHRTHQPVFQYSRREKRPDQLQQALIADPLGDLRHQLVVRDPVEGHRHTLPTLGTFPRG